MTTRVFTNDGRTAQLSPQVLESFRAGIRGELCLPGDAGYEEARTLWNAMIDRRPAIVVRASSAARRTSSGRRALPT